MDGATSIIAFTAAAAVLTVTPGLDTAIVLRASIVEGARAAGAAGLGILAGCFAWACVAAAGLGALLVASETAYAVFRWIGAAYLIWIGFKLVIRPRDAFSATALTEARSIDGRRWLSRGFLTNILNPKVGVFYATFLPLFIPAGASVALWSLLLAAIHAILGALWFGLLVISTRPIGHLLARSVVVRWLDRVTGGVFIAFGLRLALESRR